MTQTELANPVRERFLEELWGRPPCAPAALLPDEAAPFASTELEREPVVPSTEQFSPSHASSRVRHGHPGSDAFDEPLRSTVVGSANPFVSAAHPLLEKGRADRCRSPSHRRPIWSVLAGLAGASLVLFTIALDYSDDLCSQPAASSCIAPHVAGDLHGLERQLWGIRR